MAVGQLDLPFARGRGGARRGAGRKKLPCSATKARPWALSSARSRTSTRHTFCQTPSKPCRSVRIAALSAVVAGLTLTPGFMKVGSAYQASGAADLTVAPLTPLVVLGIRDVLDHANRSLNARSLAAKGLDSDATTGRNAIFWGRGRRSRVVHASRHWQFTKRVLALRGGVRRVPKRRDSRNPVMLRRAAGACSTPKINACAQRE
jgi:hypothetical protein